MQDRKGVILLFYDIPTKTRKSKKAYREFRKRLKSEGYVQLQESVYALLIRNKDTSDEKIERIKYYIPEEGNVFALKLSLKAFNSIIPLSEKRINTGLFSDDVVYIV